MQCIAMKPSSSSRSSFRLRVPVAASQSTMPSTLRSFATQFTMLVFGRANPIDGWIAPDTNVEVVDHNHFEIFVSRIFSNPVRVEQCHATQPSSTPFLNIKKNFSQISNRIIKKKKKSELILNS